MSVLEGVIDMVGRVLSGVAGDLGRLAVGWASDHPVATLGLLGGWWGVGKLGATAAKALLPRDMARAAVLLGPPLLLWAACRRTKSGRRGFVVAAPVLAGLLIVGMWVYAPEQRLVWVACTAATAVIVGATWFDEWLSGQPWTAASVREAHARDDALQATRAGVRAVAPGARISKPQRSGAGWASQVSVPAGTSPGVVTRAAMDGTLGAAASASGVPLSSVAVGAGPAGAQGRVVVHGTVAGQPHPLDEAFEYPRGGQL